MKNKDIDSDVFEKEEVKKPQVKSDKVILKLNRNRAFDLPIGRDIYSFPPYGEIEFDRSILDHKDFTDNMKKYFSVKEK